VSHISDQGYAVRVSLFYAALFLVYGVHVPYLPVWLTHRGLNETEVAAITAAPFLFRLAVTPTCAVFADGTGNHRCVVIALAWLSLAAALILGGLSGFWPLFVCAVLFAVAIATVMPLTETIALAGVKGAGLDYGRMRLWGSLTFIVAGLVAAPLIDARGADVTLYLLAAASISTVIAAHLLPLPSGKVRATDAPQRMLLGPAVWQLVVRPGFVVFLVAASFTQAAHALFYTFGTLHWQGQGISGVWIGTLWAIAVLAEVLVFAYAGSRLRTISAETLLLTAASLAVLRWLGMTFDPPIALLIPLQVLHAATYGACHLGAMTYIQRTIPDESAGTAQALYATFAAGAVMGLATLASGPLYKAYAGDAYLGMAAFAAVSVVASLMLNARRVAG
jgi:MFS transporter, PPP family, 3-phenylpropionic acid transporter